MRVVGCGCNVKGIGIERDGLWYRVNGVKFSRLILGAYGVSFRV